MAGARAAAVVVNYNGGEDLMSCVRALAASVVIDEIIVVDNDSSDGSGERVGADFPSARVIRRENDGFGGGANAGAAATDANVLVFLNPDVIASGDCLEALVEDVEQHGGLAAPALRVEAMGGVVEYGATIDYFSMVRGNQNRHPPLYVPGCALAIDHQTFDRLGGFDARYFLFAEDLELCWRALCSGSDVRVVDEVAVHGGGGSIPGGYPGHEWSTSETRIVLRERNVLATYLSCAPASMAVLFGLVNTVKLLAVSAGLAVIGRRQLAGGLMSAVVWNVRELPRTLRRRRSTPSRGIGRAAAWQRVNRSPFVFSLFRRYGAPRVSGRERRNVNS